jgi:hypothetical protein
MVDAQARKVKDRAAKKDMEGEMVEAAEKQKIEAEIEDDPYSLTAGAAQPVMNVGGEKIQMKKRRPKRVGL